VQSQALPTTSIVRPSTPASSPAATAPASAQRQTAGNSATSGPYVQAGAFGLRDNAMRRLAEVASYGPTQLLETQTAAGTPLYRVMIGPIASREEADAKAEEIASLGMAGAKVISALY
jgi:cell division protein FtsN